AGSAWAPLVGGRVEDRADHSGQEVVMPTETELEPAEREAKVLEAIELIRPALQSDGGDIVYQFIDDDGVVHVRLVGACGTCPISLQTLSAGGGRLLMDRAPGITGAGGDAMGPHPQAGPRGGGPAVGLARRPESHRHLAMG